jgi:hypothetical protein
MIKNISLKEKKYLEVYTSVVGIYKIENTFLNKHTKIRSLK